MVGGLSTGSLSPDLFPQRAAKPTQGARAAQATASMTKETAAKKIGAKIGDENGFDSAPAKVSGAVSEWLMGSHAGV